jgi:chloramphenicol-sensitive protein RarD
LIAAIGMMLELLMSGNVSWVSAVVFLGYPPYFMLHRKMKSPSALDALLIESLIVSIACLAWMTFVSPAQIIPDSAETLALLAGLGALALTGMLCLLGAGLRLPMNVFGLLGYLEPVLIMVVALFFLKENIVPQKLFAYLCFGLAVLFVFYEGLMQIIRMRQP